MYWESSTEENIHEFCGFLGSHECFLATVFYQFCLIHSYLFYIRRTVFQT